LQNLNEAMTKLKSKSEQPQTRLDALNNLLKIVKSSRLEFQHIDDIVSTVSGTLLDRTQEVRSACYRVLRHMLIDKDTAQLSWKYGLEFHLLKAMTRDQKGDVEREQAFKLVRAYVDCPDGIKFLPKSIVAILAVTTEQVDDKFRPVAVEMMCELAVCDINLILSCDGLRCIFQILLDGPRILVDLVVPTIVCILDRPETRKFIRPSVEIEVRHIGSLG
jgi:rapamycin-insensitive companion of mTOR